MRHPRFGALLIAAGMAAAFAMLPPAGRAEELRDLLPFGRTHRIARMLPTVVNITTHKMVQDPAGPSGRSRAASGRAGSAPASSSTPPA